MDTVKFTGPGSVRSVAPASRRAMRKCTAGERSLSFCCGRPPLALRLDRTASGDRDAGGGDRGGDCGGESGLPRAELACINDCSDPCRSSVWSAASRIACRASRPRADSEAPPQFSGDALSTRTDGMGMTGIRIVEGSPSAAAFFITAAGEQTGHVKDRSERAALRRGPLRHRPPAATPWSRRPPAPGCPPCAAHGANGSDQGKLFFFSPFSKFVGQYCPQLGERGLEKKLLRTHKRPRPRRGKNIPAMMSKVRPRSVRRGGARGAGACSTQIGA